MTPEPGPFYALVKIERPNELPIPESYDDDEAFEAIIVRWLNDAFKAGSAFNQLEAMEVEDPKNDFLDESLLLRRVCELFPKPSAWSENFMTAMRTIGEWSAETFHPVSDRSRNDGLLRHLESEIHELMQANAAEDFTAAREECADILILLLSYAFRNRISLPAALAAKHQKNLVRTWERDSESGLIKHVEASI